MPISTQPIEINKKFSNRESEIQFLNDLNTQEDSKILIVYGRRRVGKTELLEQTFRTRSILKFEGLEGKDEYTQRQHVLQQLSKYVNNPLLAKILTGNWLDVFDVIHKYTQKGTWTIYFEELQWLADYNDNFISELKHAWDNQFRRNPHLLLILCGSSPSFMIQHVVYSKALYNRSQHELHLQAFTAREVKSFLPKKSLREVMNALLTIGGIPEYLNRIKSASSIFVGICNQSFKPNSYFSTEYERIFISSLSQNPHYRTIIEFLSQIRFASRGEIAKQLSIESGGRLTHLLGELELCGFIQKYSPYNLPESKTLTRYCIHDAYLQFFFRFIKPQLNNIQNGMFKDEPTKAIKINHYQQWLGYSFERYCRNNHFQIAKILGFSGVKYQSGAYYSKNSNQTDPGFQIDLIFDRDDQVLTVCEIKYTEGKTGTTVIEEFERKLERLQNKKNKTIHQVLVTAAGADDALINRHYFDHIITLDDIFN